MKKLLTLALSLPLSAALAGAVEVTQPEMKEIPTHKADYSSPMFQNKAAADKALAFTLQSLGKAKRVLGSKGIVQPWTGAEAIDASVPLAARPHRFVLTYSYQADKPLQRVFGDFDARKLKAAGFVVIGIFETSGKKGNIGRFADLLSDLTAEYVPKAEADAKIKKLKNEGYIVETSPEFNGQVYLKCYMPTPMK